MGSPQDRRESGTGFAGLVYRYVAYATDDHLVSSPSLPFSMREALKGSAWIEGHTGQGGNARAQSTREICRGQRDPDHTRHDISCR